MNPRIEQLRADLASVLLEVKPLAEKSNAGTLTADEDARFDELVARAQKVQEDIKAADAQAQKAKQIIDLDSQYNRPADTVKRGVSLDTPVEPGQRTPGQGTKGQKFVDSDAFKTYARNPKGTSAAMHVDGMFPEYDRYAPGPDGEKAVIYSGTANTSALLPQVLAGYYRGTERPLVMRDVLLNMQTTSDSITVPVESGFTNSAAEVAEATSTSTGAKPESALTFTETTFPVVWIAHWVPITRQMLEDLPMMQGYVDGRLMDGLKRREDNQFLNGNGTAPNLTGILATSGIQTLDATYFTANPVATPTANVNLNKLRRAIRVVQVTGQATANFIVMNPTDLEGIDTLATTTGEYLIGGPLMPLQRTLWGRRVVESENIAAGTALVGDGTMAAVVDRKDAVIYVADQHSDFFIRNIFVLLAEERVGLPVFRPAAFAKVTLG
jgi:HK97 family phage major capsid protein